MIWEVSGLIEVLPRQFLGNCEKDYRGVSVEIRSERLSNTSLERCRCSDFLGKTLLLPGITSFQISVFLLTIASKGKGESVFYEGRKACWVFEITYFGIFTWLSLLSLCSA